MLKNKITYIKTKKDYDNLCNNQQGGDDIKDMPLYEQLGGGYIWLTIIPAIIILAISTKFGIEVKKEIKTIEDNKKEQQLIDKIQEELAFRSPSPVNITDFPTKDLVTSSSRPEQ